MDLKNRLVSCRWAVGAAGPGGNKNIFLTANGHRPAGHPVFLKKWREEELDEGGNPKIKDYPIFFAVSKIPFKDNSGNYIFVKDENGNLIFDEKGNPIYQTDLFDIANAFIKWGKERLEEGDEAFDFLDDAEVE